MAAPAAASAKSGTFSHTAFFQGWKRRSGQRSRSKSRNGSVTIIGFDISPRQNAAATSR